METLMDEVCGYINNYFCGRGDCHAGKFKFEDGTFECGYLQDGQYFRVLGSAFNDGVHRYPAAGLDDEEFTGAIWAMKVPPAFIALLSDIEDWREKYENVKSPSMSPFQSESFSDYSYSKGGVGSSAEGNQPVNWMSVFGSRLSRWRKL